MTTAVILAGAVAKGAFEAGALSVIAEKVPDVTVVVATSAGALNGTVYAAGLRYGRAPLAARVLNDLWLDQATWRRILRPSLRGILGGRGFSSASGLESVLRDGLSKVVPPALGELRDTKPISLTLVATALNGATVEQHDGYEATTFEHAMTFDGAVFDTPSGRTRACQAALASAALPLLFVPVKLPETGPAIDGGVVNNAPISHAIESAVDRAIVITGNPRVSRSRREFRFLDLFGQAADIAVNERLFRDLRTARKVNDRLERIARVLADTGADSSLSAALHSALGWKKLNLIEIRPPEALRGNAFEALGRRSYRSEYLELGERAAARALSIFR